MLQIVVPLTAEGWDEKKEEFVEPVYQTLQLEHSLVSLSKWESKWGKAFFTKKEKTDEETLDYIRCMTMTQNVKPEVYTKLTRKNFEDIERYINAPMTATYISDDGNSKSSSREVVTSELIYYWMIALDIPPEYQKWHINKLLTLIRVCNAKNQPPKKRSMKDILSGNAALNAARKKKLNTRG